MTTRNLVPRSANEGQLGTDLKPWQEVNVNKVYASNNVLVFNNVAEMKASNKVKTGYTIKTLGFYTAGDGGGADYVVTDNIGEEADEASIIALQQGLYAKLIIGSILNIQQLGAKCNSTDDDSECFVIADTIAKKRRVKHGEIGTRFVIELPNKRIKITKTVTIDPTYYGIKGLGAVIYADIEDGQVAVNIERSEELPWSNNAVPIEGFSIMGDYNNYKTNNTTGIRIACGGVVYKNICAMRFTTNIHLAENTYITAFYNVFASVGKLGLFSEMAANAGERIDFFNCLFSYNEENNIKITMEGTHNFYGCSINNATESISLGNKRVHANFYGCWFEENVTVATISADSWDNKILLDGCYILDLSNKENNYLFNSDGELNSITLNNNNFNIKERKVLCDGNASIVTRNNNFYMDKDALKEYVEDEKGIILPQFINAGIGNVINYEGSEVKKEPQWLMVPTGKGTLTLNPLKITYNTASSPNFFWIFGEWGDNNTVTLDLKITTNVNGSMHIKTANGYGIGGTYYNKKYDNYWWAKDITDNTVEYTLKKKRKGNYSFWCFEVCFPQGLNVSTVTFNKILINMF